MEEEDRAALEASLLYLRDNLDLSRVLTILRSRHTITSANEEEITAIVVRFERNRALIDCLMRKKGAMGPFLEALIETNQVFLAEHILEKKSQKSCLVETVQQNNNQEEQRSAASRGTANTGDSTESVSRTRTVDAAAAVALISDKMTELDAPAEYLVKDLLSNINLENVEKSDYEKAKRVENEWLNIDFDVIHVSAREFSSWSLISGRDTVLARVWRKVNGAFIICGRSVETEKVPIDPRKYRNETRFAASRYTPHRSDSDKCVYECLISGNPQGLIGYDSWFLPLIKLIAVPGLSRVMMEDANLHRGKADRVKECIRKKCMKQGLCEYCRNINAFSSSVFT